MASPQITLKDPGEWLKAQPKSLTDPGAWLKSHDPGQQPELESLKNEGFLPSAINSFIAPFHAVKEMFTPHTKAERMAQVDRALAVAEKSINGTPEEKKIAHDQLLAAIPLGSTIYKAKEGNVGGALGDLTGAALLGGAAKLAGTPAVAGGVKAAAREAVSTIPIRSHGIQVNVPTVLPSGMAGASAARLVGANPLVGAVVGASAPILKAGIKGGRAAVAEANALKAIRAIPNELRPPAPSVLDIPPAEIAPQMSESDFQPPKRPLPPPPPPERTPIWQNSTPQPTEVPMAPQIEPTGVLPSGRVPGNLREPLPPVATPASAPVLVTAEDIAGGATKFRKMSVADQGKARSVADAINRASSPPPAPPTQPEAMQPPLEAPVPPTVEAPAEAKATPQSIAEALRDEMRKSGTLPPEPTPEGPTPAAASLEPMLRDVGRATRTEAAKSNYRAIKAGEATPETARPAYEASGRANKIDPVRNALVDAGITGSALEELTPAELRSWVDQLAKATGQLPFSDKSITQLMNDLHRRGPEINPLTGKPIQ